ncbi:MAG: hypothetical protein JXR88_18420 [Clostridia bacterium]|nr:hypothetical protein [Clostridia bacterium]
MSYEIKRDKFFIRLFYFFLSLAGVAIGVTFIFAANIGADPINVFIQGISKTLQINLGVSITVLWLAFILLFWILGVKPYIATILDLLFFGYFVDLSMKLIVLPAPNHMLVTTLYLVVGMLLLSIFFAVYLNTQLGAGPTMLFVYAISSKTNRSIGFSKTVIDVTVLLIGFVLGGTIGFGTIIMALTIGYAVEFFTKKISLTGLS